MRAATAEIVTAFKTLRGQVGVNPCWLNLPFGGQGTMTEMESSPLSSNRDGISMLKPFSTNIRLKVSSPHTLLSSKLDGCTRARKQIFVWYSVCFVLKLMSYILLLHLATSYLFTINLKEAVCAIQCKNSIKLQFYVKLKFQYKWLIITTE